MNLNLGCGFKKIPDFLNVDSDPTCRPDQILDLEKTPWPFADDSVDQIIADHVMEHVGQATECWLRIWKEIWRVCKNGALVTIAVPHPRHDNFLTDPTHVRVVLPSTIELFDNMRNIRDHENNGQETKLGLMTGIDLEMVKAEFQWNDFWANALREGKMTLADAQRDLVVLNNVCAQIRMQVKIIKPVRGEEWLKDFAEKNS